MFLQQVAQLKLTKSKISHEALQLQRKIAKEVKIEDDFPAPRLVCGLDVSSSFFQRDADLHAAAVLLDFNTLEVIETAALSIAPTFPYRTGLLSFREGPAMIETLSQLTRKPDLLVIDGHGIAHPRRCGIASHLGVLLNMPAIGVGKTILVGKPHGEENEEKLLIHAGETVGVLWQSKKGANPLIISPGHRISFMTALTLVKQMMRKNTRLPEPTRLAHQLSNRQRIMQRLASQ